MSFFLILCKCENKLFYKQIKLVFICTFFGLAIINLNES